MEKAKNAAHAVLFTLLALGCAKQPESPPVAPKRAVPSAQSRFGIDYVFPFQRGYQKRPLAETLSQTGAGWVNFALISWAKIEPRPPRNGTHDYRWERLDAVVRLWQDYEFEITMSLRLQNGWFAGPKRYTYESKLPFILGRMYLHESDRLPAPEHRQSYQDWIEALVERYDGDGKDDMPGLKKPILHYQIGNEYMNPMFWTGTVEDYGTLLRMTKTAARRASPEARIISNGIRWNDLFFGDPKGERFNERFEAFLRRQPDETLREAWERGRLINEKTIALAKDYDVLDAGGNGPYPESSAGYMAWVKRELRKGNLSTTIWDMEARCEPYIAFLPQFNFHKELEIPGAERLLESLKQHRSPLHKEASEWYRAEQARILVKVFATRFAAGFEKVFMGMPDDWDGAPGALSTRNPYLGLTDSEGRPWPAHEALRLLVEKLDGFKTAEKIAAPEGVERYRFTFPGTRPKVDILWLADAKTRGFDDPLPRKRITLDGIHGAVTLWKTPRRRGERASGEARRSTGPLTLELTASPVLLAY